MITKFNFQNNQVRILTNEDNGNISFVAKDVCDILGYKNSSKAVKDHCKTEGCNETLVPSQGGSQMATIISEGNLYRLIMRSKKKEAEQFESWVCDEVLPSIRKHGAYMTPQTIEDALNDPDTIIRIATQLKAERLKRAELEKQNANLRIGSAILKQIAGTDELLKMDEVAKIVNCKGIGRNKLFQKLREAKILNSSNVPMQEFVNRGYFELKEKLIKRDSGAFMVKVTLCTQKGLMYICKTLNIDHVELKVSKAQ